MRFGSKYTLFGSNFSYDSVIIILCTKCKFFSMERLILYFDFLQQEKCCGVNGYEDWQTTPFTNGSHSIVPDSCCKEVKSKCGNKFSKDDIYTDVSLKS